MLIIGTLNTACGIMQGLATLQDGGSAVDAVEATLRAVEGNAEDSGVGLGGLPNLLGEVELDASIMEGTILHTGAVGALKGFLHPISIARKVMELLPHVFLAGEGAALFAEELGMEKGELLTKQARQKYAERMSAAGTLESLRAPGQDTPLREALWRNVQYRPGGTANVIAQDGDGKICCGVTTSGWAFKYPGRLGDSPIIGAGNYTDDRYGAAACTGHGEVAIRLCSAHSVVVRLAAGDSVEQATITAMREVLRLQANFPFVLNILAMDGRGHHTFCSTAPNDRFYLAATPGDSEPQELPARGVSTSSSQ